MIIWWPAAALLALLALGCRDEEPRPFSAAAADTADGARISEVLHADVVPAESLGMGGLENIVRQIARGLLDSTARTRLATSLKEPINAITGIDLSDCRAKTVAGLLKAGEVNGGNRADAVCADIRRRGDLVLYMDKAALAGWNGDGMPAVTALAEPHRPVPEGLKAFRTPMLLTQIGGDPRRINGPILVVLPFRHPSRAGGKRR